MSTCLETSLRYLLGGKYPSVARRALHEHFHGDKKEATKVKWETLFPSAARSVFVRAAFGRSDLLTSPYDYWWSGPPRVWCPCVRPSVTTSPIRNVGWIFGMLSGQAPIWRKHLQKNRNIMC